MSFTWILNLDAELELARGRPGYVAQRKLIAQLAEHGQSSRALLGPGDVLLTDAPAGASLPRRGRAWCPTPLALANLRERGVTPEPHPDAAVLRRVNHRKFAHQLGGGLPGQAYLETRAELELVLADYERRWLLKRPLSFAGRGQLRALGPLTEKQWTWVEASLARDGLLVEPLIQPLLEVSLHGFVWRDGRWELGRVCTQEISPRGAFRSVRLTEPSELTTLERDALSERGAAVAEALAHAGYFGPFGIDAYRYTDGESSAFCALGEINARYTLGFATGFPRRPGELSLE
jgi:hypothetical protein